GPMLVFWLMVGGILGLFFWIESSSVAVYFFSIICFIKEVIWRNSRGLAFAPRVLYNCVMIKLRARVNDAFQIRHCCQGSSHAVVQRARACTRRPFGPVGQPRALRSATILPVITGEFQPVG